MAPKITKPQLKQDHRGPAVGCVGESILKGVYRMLPSRRSFFKTGLLGLAGLSATRHFQKASGQSSSLLQADPLHPAAAQFDRLPLQWHKRRAKTLREKCGEKDCAAVLLQDRWNIIYYTGLFHTTTERPFWVLLPISEEAIFWYSPGLDRDLVDSWWSTDNEYYFDYLHSRKAYPNRGKVEQEETLDLWEWMLRGLKERGFANQVIGVDKELSSQQRRAAQTLLPQAAFRDISQICVDMRMVKTDEEIALTQRAYDYFSKIHAFARDYILQHGTDATDFDVSHAATEYATDLILADIQHDGKPHSAVGIEIGIGCRTGAGTAYPHPNQFFYKKIERGDALQVAGVIKIGGCGGECYRYYQILPSTARRDQVWQTVTDTALLLREQCYHGNTCSQVAYRIHKLQVERGMERLIYHRPGHGEGMEGHQPPWLALGDYTMLRKGMTFSVEPGLYDPENGFGYNPSDNCLVWDKRGIFQSSVPWTKQWMYLKL
ncbi:MAG: M24 family metallopeptidase [Acidobacteriota bacterium]